MIHTKFAFLFTFIHFQTSISVYMYLYSAIENTADKNSWFHQYLHSLQFYFFTVFIIDFYNNIAINKLMSVFLASVLLLIMNFVITAKVMDNG